MTPADLLASLLPGSVLALLAARSSRGRALLDGLLLSGLGGALLLYLLPRALARGGVVVPSLLAAGLLLGWVLARRGGVAFGGLRGVALFGLAAHLALDVAAAAPHGATSLGEWLHRLPLVVGALALAGGGVAPRSLALAALLSALVVGAVGIDARLEQPLAWLEALGGGATLALLLKAPPWAEEARAHRIAAFVGALLGLALLAGLLALHPLASAVTGELGLGVALLRLASESAPAVLLGLAGAGLLHGLLGGPSSRWLSSGGALSQTARGVALGLPLPLCSCAVLPVFRGLVTAGAPPAASYAFLVATPELGIDALLLSLPLLGVEATLARLATAAVVAFAAGLVLSRVAPPRRMAIAPPQSTAPPRGLQLVAGLRQGFGPIADHTLPWIGVGLVGGALVEPLLSPEWLVAIPSALAVPLAALAGVPAYVCAAGATPLAAVLAHKGLSTGAVVALLITGPATNVTTFGAIRALHGPRAALAFGATVASMAIACGWLVDALAPGIAPPMLHELPGREESLGGPALVVLAVVALRSLFRQGPRGVLDQLLHPLQHAKPAAVSAKRTPATA